MIVSQLIINRFFNHGFEVRGNFLKPDLIMIDKLCPENIVRAEESLAFLTQQDMRRVKFGDEKHLRGSKLYCKKTRGNA